MELRTHTNCELTDKDIKKKVKLCGWVHSNRDHGGLIFIDLRDRYGLTQIVFDPKVSKKNHEISEHLRREDVIQIAGTVRARPKDMENPNLFTGKVEVLVSDITVLNKAKTPPLEVEDRIEANEESRLTYRYIDLRRPIMQKRLKFRHDVKQAARAFLNKNSFIELETPMLVRATPEGARDYVVPSRTNPGKFYALPQSPQLYKQLSMVSGFDRYYQIARCLRDEDLRADRQPEHTQIDIEMSFVTQKDVTELVEGLFRHIFKETMNITLEKFPVITYDESMARYGTDKPDLRFDLECIDVTDIASKSDFQVFKGADKIKCINPPDMSRKDIDKFIDFAIKEGAKGMAWMRVTDKGLESNIAKFFSPKIQKELIKKAKAKPGSVLFFIADKEKVVNDVLGKLRLEVAAKLDIIKKDNFKFCWVVDFPLFEYDEDSESWVPCHHIFSSPKKEHLDFLEKDPAKVRGDLYDLVLNGIELGSGSIRIVNKELQERVMKVIGLPYEKALEKFGFLLNAFEYGAPPHGGMGLGLDRIVALMLGFNDIREVIAFPKNKNAECPMDGCPSDIPDDQMKELHIKHDIVKNKKAF